MLNNFSIVNMLVIKSAFNPWSLIYWIWILTNVLITILWIRPLYLINGQTSQIRFGLCKCGKARITDEIRIATQGSSRCKDGGRGTVMTGLDNRGKVMLLILNMNGVCSEGSNRCLTMDRSMCCSNRRSCQHRISCSQKRRELRFPQVIWWQKTIVINSV